MRSAGQSVQKYIHATVGPERVYTPKQNFNVRPCTEGKHYSTDHAPQFKQFKSIYFSGGKGRHW